MFDSKTNMDVTRPPKTAKQKRKQQKQKDIVPQEKFMLHEQGKRTQKKGDKEDLKV